MAAAPPAAPKPAAWRRWTAIVLRTAHLAAVVLTGVAVLGAPHPASGHGPAALFVSGMLLFAFELADDRVRLTELAGVVVVAKLVLCAWMLADPLRAELLFWTLLVASAVSSHAPRPLRHWAPGRRA